MDLIVGLATYNARQRSARRMALMQAGAMVWPNDLPLPEPQTPLDAWVVVLDRLPLCAAMLGRRSAPTLLISVRPLDAWLISALIPYPVLISDPATSAATLRTQLQLLLDVNDCQLILTNSSVEILLAPG